jgi:hypothetical protein
MSADPDDETHPETPWELLQQVAAATEALDSGFVNPVDAALVFNNLAALRDAAAPLPSGVQVAEASLSSPLALALAQAAVAVYPTKPGFTPSLQPHFAPDEVLYERLRVEMLLPAHAILLNARFRCIVVAVRGTAGVSDVITDLAGKPIAFAGSRCHTGVAASVNTFTSAAYGSQLTAALLKAGHLSPLSPGADSPAAASCPAAAPSACEDGLVGVLWRLLLRYPGYGVAFCGHVRALLYKRWSVERAAPTCPDKVQGTASRGCVTAEAGSPAASSAAAAAAAEQMAAFCRCPFRVHALCLATPAALGPELAALGTLTHEEAASLAAGTEPAASGASSVIGNPSGRGSGSDPAHWVQPAGVDVAVRYNAFITGSRAAAPVDDNKAARPTDEAAADSTAGGASTAAAVGAACSRPHSLIADWPIIASVVFHDDAVPTLGIDSARQLFMTLKDPRLVAQAQAALMHQLTAPVIRLAQAAQKQLAPQLAALEGAGATAAATLRMVGEEVSALPAVAGTRQAFERVGAWVRRLGPGADDTYSNEADSDDASPGSKPHAEAGKGEVDLDEAGSAAPGAAEMPVKALPDTSKAAESDHVTSTAAVSAAMAAGQRKGSLLLNAIGESTCVAATPSALSPVAIAAQPAPRSEAEAGSAAVALAAAAAAEAASPQLGAAQKPLLLQRLHSYMAATPLCRVDAALQPLVVPGLILHITRDGRTTAPLPSAESGLDATVDTVVGRRRTAMPSAGAVAPPSPTVPTGGAAAMPVAPAAATAAPEPAAALVPGATLAGSPTASNSSAVARAVPAARRLLPAEIEALQSTLRATAGRVEPAFGVYAPLSLDETVRAIVAPAGAGSLRAHVVSPDAFAQVPFSKTMLTDHAHVMYLAAIEALCTIAARGETAGTCGGAAP